MTNRDESGPNPESPMFDAQTTIELTGTAGMVSLSALDREFERAERYRAAAIAAVRLLNQERPDSAGAFELLREALLADGVPDIDPKR
jgi:hypothetical protein